MNPNIDNFEKIEHPVHLITRRNSKKKLNYFICPLVKYDEIWLYKVCGDTLYSIIKRKRYSYNYYSKMQAEDVCFKKYTYNQLVLLYKKVSRSRSTELLSPSFHFYCLLEKKHTQLLIENVCTQRKTTTQLLLLLICIERIFHCIVGALN